MEVADDSEVAVVGENSVDPRCVLWLIGRGQDENRAHLSAAHVPQDHPPTWMGADLNAEFLLTCARSDGIWSLSGSSNSGCTEKLASFGSNPVG